MQTDNVALRAVARELLHLEACQGKTLEGQKSCASTTFEKLRLYLSKLVSAAGFHSLLTRALTEGRKQDLALEGMRVRDGGHLEGLAEMTPSETAKALEVLLANLLELLFSFIGKELTVQLLRDVWPDLSLDELN